MAAIVVLGSAAVGYTASRILPLGSFSGSKSQIASQVASTSKPRTFEPMLLLPSIATEAKALPDPAVLVRAGLVDQPRDLLRREAGGAENIPPAASRPVVVLNAGAAERSSDDRPSASVAEARTSDRERADVAPLKNGKANKKPTRVAREAGPQNTKSAAAGLSVKDPALKEFMTTPIRY
jgi:hypothetical protein